MKNLAINILIILACLGMITLLVWQTFEAMNKQDEIDCNKWVKEAKEYSGTYYITKLQKEQCDTYGINIDAPIK